MEQFSKKIGFSSEGQQLQGQVCPLPGKGGIGTAKGAMGSAVLTLIL